MLITDQGEASVGLAFVTGLTFILVPSHVPEGFIVRTTYLDRAGKTLGTFEKTEYYDTWIQLFLFPVMPFKFPGTVIRDILFDLNRNTILEAHQQGIF